MFKWNELGLLARVPIASENGMKNFRGQLVETAADMKEAISRILTTGTHSGTDLGAHHDLYQFLPSYNRDIKLNELMLNRQYLRHHGNGWDFENDMQREEATQWPDIVEYLQVITIIRANAAVGPVDVEFYFNN